MNSSGLLPPGALDPFDERFYGGGVFDDDDIYEPVQEPILGRDIDVRPLRMLTLNCSIRY